MIQAVTPCSNCQKCVWFRITNEMFLMFKITISLLKTPKVYKLTLRSPALFTAPYYEPYGILSKTGLTLVPRTQPHIKCYTVDRDHRIALPARFIADPYPQPLDYKKAPRRTANPQRILIPAPVSTIFIPPQPLQPLFPPHPDYPHLPACTFYT